MGPLGASKAEPCLSANTQINIVTGIFAVSVLAFIVINAFGSAHYLKPLPLALTSVALLTTIGGAIYALNRVQQQAPPSLVPFYILTALAITNIVGGFFMSAPALGWVNNSLPIGIATVLIPSLILATWNKCR